MFNISEALDEQGIPIEPTVEWKSGLIWWVRLSFAFCTSLTKRGVATLGRLNAR